MYVRELRDLLRGLDDNMLIYADTGDKDFLPAVDRVTICPDDDPPSIEFGMEDL